VRKRKGSTIRTSVLGPSQTRRESFFRGVKTKMIIGKGGKKAGLDAKTIRTLYLGKKRSERGGGREMRLKNEN